ncbi:MAG TPA: hypothetical protein VHY22_01810, partial [Chthoniobacteraceae bacterium]|nr:hypothetical protein [Chthoniobacteraceae bacterium]
MKGFHSASEPILIDCGSKYSFFFDLIEPTWIGFNNSPLHRICTLMRKMGVKSYVKEELPIIGELADEVTAAKRRVDNRGVQGTASRLTFFRKYPKKGDWWELTEVDILGYAVIMKLVLGNSE